MDGWIEIQIKKMDVQYVWTNGMNAKLISGWIEGQIKRMSGWIARNIDKKDGQTDGQMNVWSD